MSPEPQHDATVGHTGGDVGVTWPRVHQLCQAVAGRDLGNTPLYIVPQSILPPSSCAGDHHYAFTTPSLDIYLAPYIPGYCGRGPCMVINDRALAEDYAPEDWEYLTHVHVLHELAHILDRPALYADRSGVEPNRLQFEALVVADATKRPARIDLPAYFGHGLSFIRISLHLCHRAQRLGVTVSPAAICGGHRYGLSHASLYQDALGHEPKRRARMLFHDIARIDPPQAFARLWRSDLASYHDRFPHSKGVSP